MSGPDVEHVVFLHGCGLGPGSAQSIARAFPGACLLAPEGGLVLRHGRTWFDNKRIGVARPDSVAAAEDRFLAWWQDGPLAGRPAWLCGFSNGGALAGHLLMRHPDRFRGAALLSAPLVLPPWPDGALSGKPVLYAHGGASDTVVDATFYAAAEAYLTGPAGCEATIRSYPIAHAVAPDVVDDLATWFATVRATPPPALDAGTAR